MINISNHYPGKLWKNFEIISSIPHPSYHTEALAEYICNFGIALQFETLRDKTGNILIRKPATPGYENRKTTILQAHIDMVPQKNNDTTHDFTKDPIKLQSKGEWVTATNTTLGADNGIGAASIMAILESKDIEHGPIEALFTIEEEVGMTGAFGLEKGFLRGEILLNTDTEDDREIIVGCAGGMDAAVHFNFNQEHSSADLEFFKISVSGLLGGHSGIDINLERANANLLICSLLDALSSKYNVVVSGIHGGNMRNAIPRESSAIIGIPSASTNKTIEYINLFSKTISLEYSNSDTSIKIEINKTTPTQELIPSETTTRILKAILSCPNGVLAMDSGMADIVKTSNNISIIKTNNNSVEINYLFRSSDDKHKDELRQCIQSIFQVYGGIVEFSGGYPGWKPNFDSEILKILSKSYFKIFSREAEIKVVHAGLECGIIGNTYPEVEMISFGPTIKHPHSPDEKVHIDSVGKYWELLLETLKQIPEKK